LPVLDPAAEEEHAAVRETYGIGALQDDPELAAITRFAAHLFDTPISLVSLLVGETQHFLARQGHRADREPAQHVVLLARDAAGSIMEVRDATLDSRFAENPLVSASRRSATTPGGRWCRRKASRSVRCAWSARPRGPRA
jgi:hypothetical protein